jgi:hypothetical protein
MSNIFFFVFAVWNCDSARVMSIRPAIVQRGLWSCS